MVMTVNRVKLSLIIAPLALVVLIVTYVYTLWAADRKKQFDMPVEAASAMMRDALSFHTKRGYFPENLKALEGVVWEKGKNRSFSVNFRALIHGNYHYFYTRLAPHQFTLWAIPAGEQREEGATHFLVVTPDFCRRWKGAALPLEQVDKIEPNPSLNKLGALGLVEQPLIDLKSQQKADSTLLKRKGF
jgi:nitrogen fixation-related uncharacterized protein